MKLDVGSGKASNGHAAAHVDLETGQLKCPRCDHLKVGDYEIIEKENRDLKRKVKALERDRIERRLQHHERKRILAVIDYWKQLTGHLKANTQAADRFDIVMARRAELYPFGDPIEEPPEEPCPTICLAVEGIGAFPYVVNYQRVAEGKRSQRYDTLKKALESGSKLEEFARLGWTARHRNGHGATA